VSRTNKQWGASSSYRGVSAKPANRARSRKLKRAVDAWRVRSLRPVSDLLTSVRNCGNGAETIIFDKLVHSTCPCRRNKKSWLPHSSSDRVAVRLSGVPRI